MLLSDNPHDTLNELDALARDEALELVTSLMDEGYEEATALAIAVAQARHRSEHRSNGTREHHLHVIPHPFGWALRRDGADSTSFIFATREEACEYAFELAERDGTLVLIHAAGGQIEDQIRFERLSAS